MHDEKWSMDLECHKCTVQVNIREKLSVNCLNSVCVSANMHLSVCMHACMRVCVRACMRACMRVCVCVCACIHACVCKSLYYALVCTVRNTVSVCGRGGGAGSEPVLIFLNVMASAARPPMAMHMRSINCSCVCSFWSDGRYWENPSMPLVLGMMLTSLWGRRKD